MLNYCLKWKKKKKKKNQNVLYVVAKSQDLWKNKKQKEY